MTQSIQKCSEDYKPFSDEEREKLSSALSINDTDLKLMLDCSTLILKQVTQIYELEGI